MKEPIIGQKMVFVFGSNKAGRHGAGAAKYAYRHEGAKMGIGEGITGNSYALPTKGHKIEFIPLKEVALSVARFIETAESWHNKDTQFKVTQVGCGLGGFTKEEIAPLFENTPDYCFFDKKWIPILGTEHFNYWGSF